MQMLNTTRKLLDLETKNLISIQTKTRTQQIENEDPVAVFSHSFLPRLQRPSHLRTQMML